MPTYCYTNGDRTIEEHYPMGEAPRKIRRGGRTYHRDFRAEQVGTRPPGNWPMESDALGVNPEQIAEAEAHSREIGIPTRFTKEGCAVFESPQHRKRYAEALGYFDRNGGFSDPQPK